MSTGVAMASGGLLTGGHRPQAVHPQRHQALEVGQHQAELSTAQRTRVDHGAQPVGGVVTGETIVEVVREHDLDRLGLALDGEHPAIERDLVARLAGGQP